MENTRIVLFKGNKIRKALFQNEWWFSVIDIVQALTDQSDNYTARKYWNKLAQRLRGEGSEVVTNCHRLKLLAPDGKMRETDCADTEGIFRIIQSIPSPKAEGEGVNGQNKKTPYLSPGGRDFTNLSKSDSIACVLLYSLYSLNAFRSA